MRIRRHSNAAHTIYRDLLDLLLDEEVAAVRGKPTLRQRGSHAYWYDRYRVGGDIKERYLGEDGPEMRARINDFARLREERAARSAERARLVRLLRAERMLSLDQTTGSLLAAMSAAGFFRLGGVLVGTAAFRLYEGELGIRLGFDQGISTRDIDVASFERLSFALAEIETVDPGPDVTLGDLSFEPAPSLDRRHRSWKWRQTRGEAVVEFLTPSFTDDEGIRDLPALGVSAQSLHYLNYLIGDPIAAALVYRDGVLVRVPRPERFAIHKLIVAERRRDGNTSAKARKDRLQAELLIGLLAEERPEGLREALENARSRGRRWRERIDGSLARMPEAAKLLAELA
jgi:hypothetical protein